jgi:hypothetical protein
MEALAYTIRCDRMPLDIEREQAQAVTAGAKEPVVMATMVAAAAVVVAGAAVHF